MDSAKLTRHTSFEREDLIDFVELDSFVVWFTIDLSLVTNALYNEMLHVNASN